LIPHRRTLVGVGGPVWIITLSEHTKDDIRGCVLGFLDKRRWVLLKIPRLDDDDDDVYNWIKLQGEGGFY
jgi:hypothetical protein